MAVTTKAKRGRAPTKPTDASADALKLVAAELADARGEATLEQKELIAQANAPTFNEAAESRGDLIASRSLGFIAAEIAAGKGEATPAQLEIVAAYMAVERRLCRVEAKRLRDEPEEE
jgi:hypothetical protein